MPLHRQQGFNLIEALIAMVVLTLGLLGVAAMQITAVRNTQGSYARSQATTIMNDLAERIYANKPGASSYGAFDSTVAGACAKPTICEMESAGTAPTCTAAAQMAASDLYMTACSAAGANTLLPVGSLQSQCLDNAGAVAACGSGSRIRITVNWTERGTVSESASAGAMEAANLVRQSINLVIQP
jgi:type IV pilus assembly protein PilV